MASMGASTIFASDVGSVISYFLFWRDARLTLYLFERSMTTRRETLAIRFRDGGFS